jgi:cardiolipin synthase
MTIPNFITVARFLAVPVIVFALMNADWGFAFVLFALAGISDGIDGFIARHFNQRSHLGAYLDPIADKLLLVSVFVMLAVMGELPRWLVLVVVSRDVLIVLAVMLSSLMDHPVEMKPLFVSKANTAFQIVLATLVLAELAFGFEFPEFRFLLILAVAVLTILSAAAYLVTWLRHMAGLE